MRDTEGGCAGMSKERMVVEGLAEGKEGGGAKGKPGRWVERVEAKQQETRKREERREKEERTDMEAGTKYSYVMMLKYM